MLTEEVISNKKLPICECGKRHSGRYIKCRTCLQKPCQRCKKLFIKGTGKHCSTCHTKELKKAINGF